MGGGAAISSISLDVPVTGEFAVAAVVVVSKVSTCSTVCGGRNSGNRGIGGKTKVSFNRRNKVRRVRMCSKSWFEIFQGRRSSSVAAQKWCNWV